jgi:hypothetical protein
MAKKLFPLGQVVMTPGIQELLELPPPIIKRAGGSITFQDYSTYLMCCLESHQSGDWGEVPKEDAKENRFAVKNGLRIISSYYIHPEDEKPPALDGKFWIITEADRSVTTFLLPSEY